MRARQFDLNAGTAFVPPTISGYDPAVFAVSKGFIAAAATFTNTTPTDGGGGTIVLTSAGAHGLTSAVAVGKHLPITGGTGWTVGLYAITAIDVDTTGVAVTITGTFDAGMGSPTIALVNTSAIFRTIAIPALGPNGYIKIDSNWSYPNNANQKFAEVKLNGNSIYAPPLTTSVNNRPSSIVLQNRNATNSQILSGPANSSVQNGAMAAASATFTIDTSVATSLTIGGRVATANDFIYNDRYIITVYK